MELVHPVCAQRRVGISDNRFVFVVAAVFLISITFLTVRTNTFLHLSAIQDGTTLFWWFRYLLPLAFFVFACGMLLTIRKRQQSQKERLMQIPLESPRRQQFVDCIMVLLTQAELGNSVELCYLPLWLPPNAHVTKRDGKYCLTVTYGLLLLFRQKPDQARAMLLHEISHMQADDVKFTEWTRAGAIFAVLSTIFAGAALLLVYLVRCFVFAETGNELPVVGALATALVAPLAAIFYHREYLLGREFSHDLRAVQLAGGTDSLASYLRSVESDQSERHLGGRLTAFLRHFWRFHPTPRQRLRNLENLDPYQSRAVFSPVFVGAFLALLPIQIALSISDFKLMGVFLEQWRSVLEWLVLVLSTWLLLKSDLGRLAVYLVERNRSGSKILLFFFLLLVGSAVAVLPFLLASAWMKGRAFWPNFSYTLIGVAWTAAGYCGAALTLSYIWGTRFLLRHGRVWGMLVSALYLLVSLLLILLFSWITLSRGQVSFTLNLALLLAIVATFGIAFFVVAVGGCRECGRRSWNVLFLANRCAHCGRLRLLTSVLETNAPSSS